ncbi:hypothetical protein AX15_000717 [Amanita polypyramis BW_CC]|nr:hypothetical protein AX15_000717 [Amanita polypyramis BW_CC]
MDPATGETPRPREPAYLHLASKAHVAIYDPQYEGAHNAQIFPLPGVPPSLSSPMTTPPSASSRSRKRASRSKTLPAVPLVEEQVAEREPALARSHTIGTTSGGSHGENNRIMSDRRAAITKLEEENEEVGDSDRDNAARDDPSNNDSNEPKADSPTQTPHTYPRRHSTSVQRSAHRNYFVYTDPSSTVPALHLRKHHRSKTLPDVPVHNTPVLPDLPVRSHSVGVVSDHARPRVDDGDFWKDRAQGEPQQQHESDGAPRSTPQITDHSTPTEKAPETLPTIPGSSGSSDVANDTQMSSPAPMRTEDTMTDTQTTTVRSQLTRTRLIPSSSSTKRGMDHRQWGDSTEIESKIEFDNQHLPPTPESSNFRIYPSQGPAQERRTRRHSGTTKPPQSALSLGRANTRPSRMGDAMEHGEGIRRAQSQSPPPPELPTKEARSDNIVKESPRNSKPEPPLPPKSKQKQKHSMAKGSDGSSRPHRRAPDVVVIDRKDKSVAKGDSSDPEEKGEGPEVPSTVTQYMNMLLAVDKIPPIHNIAASFFTWILLAGFVLFPGTFNSLRNSGSTSSNVTGQLANEVLNVVNHVSLFVIAFLCCGIGTAGMGYLWWRWMNNYVWLVNKIFLPGLFNSLAGLISTISSVYGAQQGQFSVASKITLVVTASTTFICGVISLYYILWKIRRVKFQHNQQVGKERVGKHGEGFIEQMRRKANKKAVHVSSLV